MHEVLEVAVLDVRAGQRGGFVAAFREAQEILSAAPGYQRHELRRCVEAPDRYLLLVWWDSLESHTEGFRKSPGYERWRRLLHLSTTPSPRWSTTDRRSSPPRAAAIMDPGSALRRLADDLWVVERPQSFHGLPVGTRMSVIRLAGGRLLLHSPVSLDPGLRAQLDALGQVSFAVAPNRLHHLYAGEVARAYPGARLWIAPGLERKRPDLAFEAVLTDEAPVEWRGQVDQTFFRGRPYENEVAFFHRASRTLLLCDLAFHFGPSAAAPTRLLMKLLRSYGRLGPSKLDPLLIRDRRAARESLERILAWDFDRVVVAHGDVQESDGRAILREGYSWLLSARR